jgi:hypothetical protein
LIPLAFAFGFSVISAAADMPAGKINHDMVVGASHDIALKAGQAVQVMGQSGGKVVIMVTLPDGSNGVFQVDAADVTLAAAAPAVAPAPPPTPVAPVTAPIPSAPTPAPTPPAAATAPVTAPAPADQNQVRPPISLPNPATAYGPPPSGTAESVFSAPSANATPPAYPKDFAGGAEFETTAGKKGAGTASVVHLEGEMQTYLISARHLLGPDGGFDKQTAAPDVPAFVQAINIHSFGGGSTHYAVTGLVVPATTVQAGANGVPMDDMAIYANQDSSEQDNALVLASQFPKLHEQLWVVARVRGGVPEGQVLQPVKVDHFFNGWIVAKFDNDKIEPAGASGAPVLNAAGEVVGVYSGHNTSHGHVYAFIIPATMIVNVIRQAPGQ